jgi:hypothetical protein
MGRARRQSRRDLQYRKALGVPEGQPLPAQLGAAVSTGSARRGRAHKIPLTGRHPA